MGERTVLSISWRRLAVGLVLAAGLPGCVHVLVAMAANPAPVRVAQVDGVVTMESGLFHACLALEDSRIRCGHHDADGFGVRWTSRLDRLFVGTTQFMQAEALKRDFVCGQDANGAVMCWSDEGRMVNLVPGGAVDLAGSGALACVLLQDGGGRCWQLGHGLDSVQPFDPFPRIDPGDGARPVRLARGFLHHCALLDDGTVACWGANDVGQLGRATHGEEGGPVPARVLQGPGRPLDGVVAIAARHRYTCAVRKDGTVVCWGGLPGFEGFAQKRSVPVEVRGVRQAVAVSAGDAHACALGAGGEVSCWGQNESGQLGDGTTNSRETSGGEDWNVEARPVAGLPRAAAISAGVRRTCALVEGGGIWCWGQSTARPWTE